jgi:hypothetical protein
MTLVADSSGVVVGRFQIPEGVPSGTKEVTFTGAGGSHAKSSFFGLGTQVDEIRTAVTTVEVVTWTPQIDPIAQTFSLNSGMQVEGVDLYFGAVGSTTVSVQIRETQVGFPTLNAIADSRLVASAITPNAWNRFVFTAPILLEPNVEYAIVALCNDEVSEVGVAELGKFDAFAQQWVTSQPYNVGVLLSSSNGSTWTPYQDRDLAFRLHARSFTETERLVDLGAVSIATATDLLTMTTIDSPKSSATGELELTLPDGSVVKAGDNQRIRLGGLTTGTVGVKVRLRADEYASAALYPGTQIIEGEAKDTGIYISNAVDADAAGCTVKIIYEAIVPSGSTVTPDISGLDSGDPWLPLTPIGIPRLLNGDIGLYEFQFERTGVTEARIHARLSLSGTPAARPRVRNLRLFTF